jgi:hypothetical protein
MNVYRDHDGVLGGQHVDLITGHLTRPIRHDSIDVVGRYEP